MRILPVGERPSGNVFLVQWVNGTTVYQQMVVMNGPGTINFISVKVINDRTSEPEHDGGCRNA
jgi:hypothetical protein